ncbi:MAG: hypothetical protein GDA50_08230 [Alphaproteobacteria bacterium GM202ARS2]|nr:hypothetical protein [Alphaproteobacteria bacterium GM202ARS2]
MDDQAPYPSAQKLVERLTAMGLDMDGELSVASYIGHFDLLPSKAAYNHVPQAITERCTAIAEAGGEQAVETYHRLVITTLVDAFDQRAAACDLPSWLKEPTRRRLDDILRSLETPRRHQLRLERDDFLKDLAVCRLKLWPLGVELVDTDGGLPRRILLGGLRQAISAVSHVTLSLGGLGPFLETHFDSRRAQAFSPEGYHHLYLMIARLLRDRPAFKGLISTSWWHDPAVSRISPNLAFLNSLPVNAGARVYRMYSDEQTTKSATRLSKERMTLYREGNYLPTNYTLAWGRRDLLRWADAQEADGAIA